MKDDLVHCSSGLGFRVCPFARVGMLESIEGSSGRSRKSWRVMS